MEQIDECRMLGMLGDEGFEKVRRVDSTEAACPTISTKEDRIKVMINDTVCVGGLLEMNKDGLVNTLTTVQKDNLQAYRIRKLTPKECWRLMGYTDKDFEKAAEVNSNTQLYKQAGNAIVKQVLMAIFEKMIK